MKLPFRKCFQILAPSNSLRTRIAYSLALVRLILVPVVFLAVYYLFRMGWIVDRIVNVDAQAAALAQQASIEMLEARRAERNYFLLHDPSYLETSRAALQKTHQNLESVRNLEPDDRRTIRRASEALTLYQQRFAAAAAVLNQPGKQPADRIRTAVKAYEQDLDNLLKRRRRGRREQFIEELRKRIGSFDARILETVQEGNPELQRVTEDLQASGQEILQLTAELESVNWSRVRKDHAEARDLIQQAEWALGIVSAMTLLISVWVSYVLPRQVIKPLLNLKEAVDHAATGNYEIDFDVQGKGETVELANSLRRMFAAIRQKV